VKPLSLIAASLAFTALSPHAVPSLVAAAARKAASHVAVSKALPAPTQIPNALTRHSVEASGRRIDYAATAGTIILRNDRRQPIASVFYVAYVENGADRATRPVTFLYNGGPGSSSIWLHMGAFGPKRVVTSDAQATPPAPYRLTENEYTLLDKSDLVFVDAVGTGFSRIIGAGTGKDFFGTDPDVEAFGQFIQRWVGINDRWASPKFLLGESYGTTRSAALVDYLQKRGMAFNGVVLLSSALNFLEFFGGDGNDMTYELYLPTEAAVAFYHHKLPGAPPNLASLLEQVQAFATGEYADALMKGAALDANTRADVLHKLHQYTGISEDYFREVNLRIEPEQFEMELLRGEAMTTGRLDARFTGIDTHPVGEEPQYDPSDTAINAAFTAVFNDYIRNDLHYRSDAVYKPTNYPVVDRNWDDKHKVGAQTIPYEDVLPDLREAMTQNPNLRVFSANGYYDMATPYYATVYLLRHMDLDPRLQDHISYGYYDSGHMVYLHVPALAAFHRDLDRFYDSALAR